LRLNNPIVVALVAVAVSLALVGVAKATWFYVLLWPPRNDALSLLLCAAGVALVARLLRR
jgi:hypothetical protein